MVSFCIVGSKRKKHTSNNWDVNGSALEANVARSEKRSKKTSIGGVSLLFNLVAAVELGVAASLNTLFYSIIALDGSFIGSAVTRILAFVAHILVPLSIVTRGGYLSGD